MSLNLWIRQTHRWLSIAFVLSVITYAIVMSRGPVPGWLNIFPAGSLILMVLTGAWLFVLPYVVKSRKTTRSTSLRRQGASPKPPSP